MTAHRPRKRFGQHFLTDPQVLHDIVLAVSPNKEDHIVEIGPGEGVLTQLILPLCKHLDIIEIDRDLCAYLRTHFIDTPTLSIHEADILRFDFSTLDMQTQPRRIIGNLPYNISTPLLFRLFELTSSIIDMHFLLQKEVVDRMAATVGDRHYGRLSVMTQYYCYAESLFPVGPNSFNPPPKVDSAVIRLAPHKELPVTANDINMLSKVVKEAFTYRRKTLANSLKKYINNDELNALGIDPKKRPQELSIAEFVAIANTLTVKC